MLIPFLLSRKSYGSKGFQEMGNFRSLKGFGKFEAVASLDAYQITNYQFPSKTHHFLLLDFQRIREEVFKSGISWPIAWAGVIKRFIWFFRIVPSGHQGLLFKWFQNKRECLSRWIHHQQSSPNLSRSKIKHLKNIFIFIFLFALTLWSWNLFLFRNISRIHSDKGIWNTSSFISCIC